MKKLFDRKNEKLDYYTEDEFEVMDLDEEYDEPEEAEEYYEIEETEEDEEYYEFEEAGDEEYYEIEETEEDEEYYETEAIEDEEYYEIEDLEEDEEYYEAEATEDEEYYEIEDEEVYYKSEEITDEEYYEIEELEDEEYYESEETEDGEEYYEMDEYGDESEYYYEEYDDEDYREEGNIIERAIAFLSNMSGMDRLIAATGALVLIFALVAGSLFVSAKVGENQVEAFANLGTELDDVEILGEGGLMAVADAKMAQQEAAELAAEEAETETEEVVENEIQVAMNLSSIQKDLKIKFINKKSSKLIASVPFEVEVVDAEGKTYSLIDEDMDGIIYQTGIVPGEYKVAMVELEERKEYSFSTEPQKVTVKDEIEYKKVDVEDEIKSEAEVNAAVEDTKVQQTEVESTNKDTVAFVESTRTEIEGGSYKEISKATITDPSTTAKVFRLDSFMRLSAVATTAQAPTVYLSSSSEEIAVGKTVQLTATITDGIPIWESSDPAIASVDSNGLVEGEGPGTATITVTVTSMDGISTVSASCTVTVSETKITLSQSDVSLYAGQTVQLSASSNGGGTIAWDSSDNSVATVDDNGVVTGVSEGNTTIIASSDGVSASCAVKVSATQTTISATSLSIKVGETATLTVDVDGADHNVKWESSNAEVASVDGNGVVTGKSAGTATITATANGNSATCAVTVESGTTVDMKTALKDNSGNQVYVQNRNGEYVPAVYEDYYNYDKFYIKQSSYKYTGWQTIDGSVYYYDADGNVVKGTQVIQGATYNFDTTTGALVTSSGTLGIDVSKWNGDIDWNAVKNSGINYVIIRCGYRGSTTGALIEDPKFKTNIKGASAAGLKVGVYFFTQATNEVEAVEEASMVLSLIKGYNISYPVFLDVEPSGGRADSISAEVRTAVCKAFCQTISNSGYATGIYANKTWLESKIHTNSLSSSYKIWLAQYAATPTYGGKYNMWQYTSKGSVNGIKGNVDLNLSYLGY